MNSKNIQENRKENRAAEPVAVSGFSLEEIARQMGNEIFLHGSVYKLRRMSGFAFVLLHTGRYVLQCVYSPEFSRFSLEELAEESCVRIRALVAAEERSRLGWELQLRELEVLSVPAEPMPIVINQKKVDASLEKQLDYRMLTLRNENSGLFSAFRRGSVGASAASCRAGISPKSIPPSWWRRGRRAAPISLPWTISAGRPIWPRALSFTSR